MMQTAVTKTQLRQWLREGRTNRVITALVNGVKEDEYKAFQDAILMQSAQWQDWQNEKASATLSQDELTAKRNRIHANLIHWIGALPNDTPLSILTELLEKADEQDQLVPFPKTNKGLWVAVGLVVLGVGIWFLKDAFSGTFTQTIIVRDAKNEVILNNQGKVILESRFKLDSAQIGTNGEALFNLPSNYVGETIKMRISHEQAYQALSLDSVYKIGKNKPLQLTIELRNLDKLVGEIIDANTEQPLDSVRVSIQDIETYTNRNGWFKLDIPMDKRAAFHRVALDKKGFHRETFDQVPIMVGKELRWAMRPK
jgi:Effector-associated domain 11